MKSLTMILHPVPAGGTGRSASEGASAQGAALHAEAAVPGTDVQMGAAQGTAVQEGTVQEAAALWYGDEVVAYREAADSLHTQRQAAGRSEAGSGEAGTQPHTAGAATVQTHRTNDATAAHRSGTTERQGHASETAGAGARHADEAQHTAGQHATQRSARRQHATGSRAEHAGSKETATGQQSGHAAATDTARKQTERTAGTQQKSGSAAAQHTTGSQQAESAADARHNDAGYTATQHTADARHSAAVGSASPAAAGMRAETQTEAAAQLPDSLAAAMPDSLRMEADSLTGSLAGADTLWESPLGAFMPGDSLYAHATTLHYLPDGTPLEGYRTVGAGEFFGQQSLLAAPRPAAQQQPRLTDELPFQGLVLLLTLLFGLLLYRNPGDMRALVGRVAFERRDSERTSDESGNAGFTRFLNIALALGFLLAGVTAVRLCDRPDIAQELLSMGNGSTLSLLLALGVGLLFLLVYLYGILLLRAVGGVTLTSGFTTQLIRIKRGYAALGAIILAPVILLFALSPLGSDTIWAGLLTAGWLITFLLYLRETFALFISKKVSILHWILYLCAVEIFPVTLLWLLVVR
ncbi:DUF4271 domain-containing protein [uncultured Alistipes sp.]|uniref:DUF4271 domain-containing protein n=1 Tax=uncultured Alistipes sp. TaxID=538949 RepID=UPI00261D879A|nr:DUF4271 domain-containing protein [uncultured Alistipes sp.]